MTGFETEACPPICKGGATKETKGSRARERVGNHRLTPAATNTFFYGYDDSGNACCYTENTTLIRETYVYDASNAQFPNPQYPITNIQPGEQFDPDLGLYFLRARYMDTDRGRFWSMDTFEGWHQDPSSLHKYIYAENDPVGRIDPSGQLSYVEVLVVTDIILILHVVWHSLYPPPVTGLKWHGTMFGAGGAFGVGGGRFDFDLTSEPYPTGRVLNAWQKLRVKVVTWFFMVWVSPFPGTVLPGTGSVGGNVDLETVDADANHFNGVFVMESVGAGALFGVGVQKIALGHASGEAQITLAPSPIGIGAAFLVGGAEVDGSPTPLPATQPSP